MRQRRARLIKWKRFNRRQYEAYMKSKPKLVNPIDRRGTSHYKVPKGWKLAAGRWLGWSRHRKNKRY